MSKVTVAALMSQMQARDALIDAEVADLRKQVALLRERLGEQPAPVAAPAPAPAQYLAPVEGGWRVVGWRNAWDMNRAFDAIRARAPDAKLKVRGDCILAV